MQHAVNSASPRGPLPGFQHLLRVIPVAQFQAQNGTAITLLSAEVYRDGVVIVLRVQADATHYPGAETPWLVPEVTDDAGRRLAPHLMGGHGGGGPDRLDWRLTFGLATPGDSGVSALQIALPRLDLTRFDRAEGRRVDVGHVDGPWVFNVPLG